jgi:hypothetical protein
VEDIPLFPRGGFRFGGERPQPLLAVFLSPDCGICTKVAGYTRAIAATYRRDEVDVLVVIHATPRLAREFVATQQLENLPVALRQHFPAVLAPKSTPFGIVLAPDGFVAARGMPNALEHLEEMIDAGKHGNPMTRESTPTTYSWGDAVPQSGALVGHHINHSDMHEGGSPVAAGAGAGGKEEEHL